MSFGFGLDMGWFDLGFGFSVWFDCLTGLIGFLCNWFGLTGFDLFWVCFLLNLSV